MSSMQQSGEDQTDREEILSMIHETMEDLHDRILSATVDSMEAEELHLKRVRTLGYLANQYRKLKRDTDIDEMEDDLELLKTVEQMED